MGKYAFSFSSAFYTIDSNTQILTYIFLSQNKLKCAGKDRHCSLIIYLRRAPSFCSLMEHFLLTLIRYDKLKTGILPFE